MNPQQIELIQSSWKKVLPIADTAADLFYGRVFEIAPGARALFAEDMAKQKKALLAMLGRVVASLNDLGGLVPAVQELGERHIGYGVEPAHYAVVGEALLWTLEQGLGDDWNSDLSDAWASAYGVLSTTMIDAANARAESDRKLEEEAARAEAEQQAAERKAEAEAEKAEAEAKVIAEADAVAIVEAEKAEAEAKVVAEADAVAIAEAEKAAEKKAKKKARRNGGSSVAGAATTDQKAVKAELASGPHRQLVVFDLDEEQYGLNIDAVREIIRLQQITRVPRAPEFVEGVINLRGKIIPVVDLRKRFEMKAVERDEDFRIVVVDVKGNEIGMIVDAVTEVSRVPESGIEPPSSVIAADDSDYLTGIAKTGQEMIILLDIGNLISVEEVQATAAAATEEAEAA